MRGPFPASRALARFAPRPDLVAPMLALPGNHDHRDLMRTAGNGRMCGQPGPGQFDLTDGYASAAAT
jgi:hypothetical protein